MGKRKARRGKDVNAKKIKIITSTPKPIKLIHTKVLNNEPHKSNESIIINDKPKEKDNMQNDPDLIDLTLPLEKTLETITIQDDDNSENEKTITPSIPDNNNLKNRENVIVIQDTDKPEDEDQTIVIQDSDNPGNGKKAVITNTNNPKLSDTQNDDSVIFICEYKPPEPEKNVSTGTQMTPARPLFNSVAVNTSFVPNNNMPVNLNFGTDNTNISHFIKKLLDLEEKFVQNFSIPNSAKNVNPLSNVYNPNVKKKVGLRLIVIDGSNVAMGHSNGAYFSCRGLKICIDYFVNRGHEVKAFVPQFRRNSHQSQFPEILEDLAKQSLVVFTPSRRVQGRMIVPYDDRFIVQCAHENNGIIVSNDNYRDLLQENPVWKKTIEKRLLMWTWCGDMIMFPQDPFGRGGPSLNEFLRF